MCPTLFDVCEQLYVCEGCKGLELWEQSDPVYVLVTHKNIVQQRRICIEMFLEGSSFLPRRKCKKGKFKVSSPGTPIQGGGRRGKSASSIKKTQFQHICTKMIR